jgi:hypothetical protein
LILIVPRPEHTRTQGPRLVALAPAYFVTSTAPHSLFVALALALIAELRQVGSMRHNAPVDVGAVPAQLHETPQAAQLLVLERGAARGAEQQQGLP